MKKAFEVIEMPVIEEITRDDGVKQIGAWLRYRNEYGGINDELFISAGSLDKPAPSLTPATLYALEWSRDLTTWTHVTYFFDKPTLTDIKDAVSAFLVTPKTIETTLDPFVFYVVVERERIPKGIPSTFHVRVTVKDAK